MKPLLPISQPGASKNRNTRPHFNGWAWVIALSPSAYWLVTRVAPLVNLSNDDSRIVLTVIFFAHWVICLFDSNKLRDVAVRLSAWWGILIPPVYLFLRAKRLGRGHVLFALWFGAHVAGFAIAILLLVAGGASRP